MTSSPKTIPKPNPKFMNDPIIETLVVIPPISSADFERSEQEYSYNLQSRPL